MDLNKTEDYVVTLERIGTVYKNKNNSRKADEFFTKAKKLREELGLVENHPYAESDEFEDEE